MKIQLLQPWGGQGIGAIVYTDSETGQELYSRNWATILDPSDMMPAVGSNGRPNYPSDVFDTTTSATVVYEGWNQGTNYLIRKTDLSAGTRTWATGAWSSRTSLTYA